MVGASIHFEIHCVDVLPGHRTLVPDESGQAGARVLRVQGAVRYARNSPCRLVCLAFSKIRGEFRTRNVEYRCEKEKWEKMESRLDLHFKLHYSLIVNRNSKFTASTRQPGHRTSVSDESGQAGARMHMELLVNRKM